MSLNIDNTRIVLNVSKSGMKPGYTI